MTKQEKLDYLKKEIIDCRECRAGKSGKIVFGEGNSNAYIMFIGEAPGKNEAKEGRPFIGRSGQLLRRLIREVELSEKDVYITSPIKYLPDSGTPTLKDIKHAFAHFNKQIEIIDPKVIVLLGKTAIKAVLEEDIPIMKNHGKVVKKDGRTYFLTLHPAAAIRFAKNKPILEHDFKKLSELV